MSKLNLVAEPGQHMVQITREFDAPPELVFKANTDPELVARWWGLRGTTTIVDKLDAKPGGIWRYVQHDTDGNEYGFFGVFHQVTPPERLVYTFEFEGMPGHILLETIEFVEVNGKTRLIDTSVFQTVEDRDGMIASGMESGADESWDQLDDLLKSLQ